jgi:outer membrane protein OmpA-like peptidoglycan-associated protein
MRRFIYKILSFFALSVLLFPTPSQSQSTAGRVAFGFDAMGNKLYGNFRDNQFWFSGDVFLRWNIVDYVSLHVGYSGGQMRMRLNDDNLKAYPRYFGNFGDGIGDQDAFYPDRGDVSLQTDIRREDKNKVRHGGIEIMGSFNFAPLQEFVPYLIAGVEIFNFEPRNLNQDKGLPYLSQVGYERNTIGFVGGIGYELYLTDNFVFNGKGLLHLPNTDFLDDFSQNVYDYFVTNPHGLNPPKEGVSSDVFLTFGIGLSYYIFGDQDTDKDGLRDAAERDIYHTDPLNPDTDGDGLGDGKEVREYSTDPTKADTDGDGLADNEELMTYKTDPVVADGDGDGLNDGSEIKAYKTNPLSPDSDNDGLTDGREINDHKTNPLSTDTDADGLSDGDEIQKYSSSPTKADSDGDGLTDGSEALTHKTALDKADTDGDALSDGDEINRYGTNALERDTDDDALSDGDEVNQHKTNPKIADTDNDELKDGEELNRTKTNPLNADTDGDKVTDGKDKCPLIAGVPPEGCPAKPKPETVANFPGVIFLVNQDAFDLSEPGTLENLNKIKALVEQCPDLKVEIEGHASTEGDAKRNQELSDLRAARVKQWLVDQGVNPNKIVRTIGYGSSRNLVPEPKTSRKVTAAQVEQARRQNRRIAVRVVETCK